MVQQEVIQMLEVPSVINAAYWSGRSAANRLEFDPAGIANWLSDMQTRPVPLS